MNMWDERYGQKDYFYGTDPNDFLRERASSLWKAGDRILCLAEGEGRNAVFLAGLGFSATAVDGSAAGLSKLKRLAAERGVNVSAIQSDLADFQIEEKAWDGIVSIWCHLPRELRQKVHHGCVRGLKQGGWFLLEAYTPEQLKYKTGGPQNPDMMPTLADLHSELAGLRFSHEVEMVREVHEGTGHEGLSAVVQLVGSKA